MLLHIDIYKLHLYRKRITTTRGVEFVGIAIWDEKNSIDKFIKNYDIQYEILIDKEGFTAVNFGVIAVPEKFFVKSDGSFAFKIRPDKKNPIAPNNEIMNLILC